MKLRARFGSAVRQFGSYSAGWAAFFFRRPQNVYQLPPTTPETRGERFARTLGL